jgi:hypothetical protein
MAGIDALGQSFGEGFAKRLCRIWNGGAIFGGLSVTRSME